MRSRPYLEACRRRMDGRLRGDFIERFGGGMNDPKSPTEWRASATARRRDAGALEAAERHLAAHYFLGFAVECSVKSLLAHNARFAQKMRQSHNLVELLELSGVPRQKIPKGLRRVAETRDVSLRYQAEIPSDVASEDLPLLQALLSWTSTRASREINEVLRKQRLKELKRSENEHR